MEFPSKQLPLSRQTIGFTLLEVLLSIAILSAIVVSANTIAQGASERIRLADLQGRAQFVLEHWHADAATQDPPPESWRARDNAGDLWLVTSRDLRGSEPMPLRSGHAGDAAQLGTGPQARWYEITARHHSVDFSVKRVVARSVSGTSAER